MPRNCSSTCASKGSDSDITAHFSTPPTLPGSSKAPALLADDNEDDDEKEGVANEPDPCPCCDDDGGFEEPSMALMMASAKAAELPVTLFRRALVAAYIGVSADEEEAEEEGDGVSVTDSSFFMNRLDFLDMGRSSMATIGGAVSTPPLDSSSSAEAAEEEEAAESAPNVFAICFFLDWYSVEGRTEGCFDSSAPTSGTDPARADSKVA